MWQPETFHILHSVSWYLQEWMWKFRQCWHHGTSTARLLSCNCSSWWQMCAMTYQVNSHSYIFFPDCDVKYKSEQECFGHVQTSALSWLDRQKQQTHKIYIEIYNGWYPNCACFKKQNKSPTCSSRINFHEGCSLVHICFSSTLGSKYLEISTPITAPLAYVVGKIHI